MRDHETIVEDLAKARVGYHAAANTLPAPKLQELAVGIARLQAEEVNALRVGAIPCQGCGELPHAMHKGPASYEIGCLNCKPRPEPSPDNPRMIVMTQPRARGESAQAAVAAWNRGNATKRNREG